VGKQIKTYDKNYYSKSKTRIPPNERRKSFNAIDRLQKIVFKPLREMPFINQASN
jgi:hypothetical protein